MLRIQINFVNRLTLVASREIWPRAKIHGFVCLLGGAKVAPGQLLMENWAKVALPDGQTKPWMSWGQILKLATKVSYIHIYI